VWNLFSAGGEDDDRGGGDLRRLPAAAARQLHRGQPAPARDRVRLVPAAVPGHLLAGDEQRHVQSAHLLLDERQVTDDCARHTVRFIRSSKNLAIKKPWGAILPSLWNYL